jgi:surface carbohydrate biosynthesis protein
MRRHGIKTWYLEEEGGIYQGDSEQEWCQFLDKRMDPAALGEQDKVLTWGEWQREYLAAKRSKADILTSGSANFEMLHPHYHEALREFDLAETGDQEDFILVNTRFTVSNARDNGSSHFIHDSLVTEIFDRETLFRKLASDGMLFHAFIDLIATLSFQFPSKQIVVRPHPAENAETYQRIFAPVSNVTVASSGDPGSWIRHCSCLIHNGCSTAVQADIAEKPVITFVPSQDKAEFIAGLPNRVGVTLRTAGEVAEFLSKQPGHDDNSAAQWQRTISRLDTIDFVTYLVGQEGFQHPPLRRAQARRLALQYDAWELPRKVARFALPAKRRFYRHRLGLFDHSFFERLPDLGACAAAHYGHPVHVQRLSSFCYLFSPR